MIPVDAPDALQLFDALTRAETSLWHRVEDDLRRTERLSLVEITTLRAVEAVGAGARVTDLVHHLGISVGAASKAVDRLERAGLARRTPAPDDRRSSLVALTVAGHRALAAGEEAMLHALDPVVSSSEVDISALTAALLTLLDRTRSDLGAAQPSTSRPPVQPTTSGATR